MRLAAAVVMCGLAGTAWAQVPGLALKLDGDVQAAQVFSADQVKAFPARQVDVSYQTMHGTEHHAWTGVLLWDLVNKAGFKNGGGKNPGLRHTLVVRAKDGYAAVLSIGEIDPALEGKPVILAYRQDDRPGDLPALKLIVPGDKMGARMVRDVTEVEVH
jgi:hypothetical protein